MEFRAYHYWGGLLPERGGYGGEREVEVERRNSEEGYQVFSRRAYW
jgi:hypothetical protein